MDAEPLIAWSPAPPPRHLRGFARELAFAAALSLGFAVLVGELDALLRRGPDAPAGATGAAADGD